MWFLLATREAPLFSLIDYNCYHFDTKLLYLENCLSNQFYNLSIYWSAMANDNLKSQQIFRIFVLNSLPAGSSHLLFDGVGLKSRLLYFTYTSSYYNLDSSRTKTCRWRLKTFKPLQEFELSSLGQESFIPPFWRENRCIFCAGSHC